MARFINGRSARGRLGLALLIMCYGVLAHAGSFCFLSASNYYEQVYCELTALGKASQLPALYEFRNNDQVTQALLLKGPARTAGIDLKMPERRPHSQSASDRAAALPPAIRPPETDHRGAASRSQTGDTHPLLAACRLSRDSIACGDRVFRFAGNRLNQSLPQAVFSPDNRLGLPHFRETLTNADAVAAYLDEVYPVYLRKMIDLGLGEATMTYRKFAAIFQDVTAKGVSFSERLETMYHYLKKDKRTMGVNVSKTVPRELSLEACEQLPPAMVRCVLTGRNFLFVGES